MKRRRRVRAQTPVASLICLTSLSIGVLLVFALALERSGL